MKITAKRLFTTGLVVLLIAVVVIAAGYNSQARMMPLFIGVPVLILAVWQMISDWRESPKSEEKPVAEEIPSPVKAGNPWIIFGWVLVMFILVYLFGFIVTTFVYPLFYLRFQGRRGWLLSLGVSVGSLIFMYVLMIIALDVQLYEGVIILQLRKTFMGY